MKIDKWYDEARAIEIELPKRVPTVEEASYWRKGASFGKHRVYINLKDSTKQIWFDLRSLKLEGIDNQEIENTCISILAPWLEPTPAPKPESPEDLARRIEDCF